MSRPFDFSEITKRQAFLRQSNLCAHCGASLIDSYDHAHHVIPNQLGRPGNRADTWMRELDNCMVLCDTCHDRVHEDGRFRDGAVASPHDFPFSHGSNTAEHRAWATRMEPKFWR